MAAGGNQKLHETRAAQKRQQHGQQQSVRRRAGGVFNDDAHLPAGENRR
jgi:hypothetical protein